MPTSPMHCVITIQLPRNVGFFCQHNTPSEIAKIHVDLYCVEKRVRIGWVRCHRRGVGALAALLHRWSVSRRAAVHARLLNRETVICTPNTDPGELPPKADLALRNRLDFRFVSVIIWTTQKIFRFPENSGGSCAQISHCTVEGHGAGSLRLPWAAVGVCLSVSAVSVQEGRRKEATDKNAQMISTHIDGFEDKSSR